MGISSGSGIWIAAALAVCVLAAACGGDAVVDNTALRERLQYLENDHHVTWLDFEGGNVYVGFSERPAGLANLVNSALTVAHKAHGKKVHIYAVKGGQPGWRPGDGPVLCEATMKLGVPGQICT
jgi:hypothetical protein